ncbi:hypothetical protein Syun_029310 [Stephania yunnanensis]|uniref:Uncharacterized protein n=1 Tax=Stephania yunnanensis TaxID=152371 RepID=A0AAP0E5D9_9MAGN
MTSLFAFSGLYVAWKRPPPLSLDKIWLGKKEAGWKIGGGRWPEGRPLHAKEIKEREDGCQRWWMVTMAQSMAGDHVTTRCGSADNAEAQTAAPSSMKSDQQAAVARAVGALMGIDSRWRRGSGEDD